MAPPAGDKKADKSYLSTAVDSINPWAGSRSVTPTPKDPQPAPSVTNPGDHSTSHLYGQSFKRYPLDCPPLKVQWFHAVDVSELTVRDMLFVWLTCISIDSETKAQVSESKKYPG